MLPWILQTISGLLLSLMGGYMPVIYIQELKNGSSPLLLVIATFMLGLGIFFFVNVWRSIAKRKNHEDNQIELSSTQADLEKRLEKNSSLDAEWTKTNEARNRLQMLELSAEANGDK